MNKTIGEEIAQIRIDKSVTLRKLSEKLSLGNNGHIMLSNIECDRVIPDKDLLKKILIELDTLDKFDYINEIIKTSKANSDYTCDKDFELPIYFKTVKRNKI